MASALPGRHEEVTMRAAWLLFAAGLLSAGVAEADPSSLQLVALVSFKEHLNRFTAPA